MLQRNTDQQVEYVSSIDAFFTICSKNFLAHARVLHNSVRAHYPNTRFIVVLCDRVDGHFDPSLEPFEFVYLEALGLPDLNGMAQRYNITEFNTSVKPFAFMHLMSKYGFETVVYLDPDLLLVDRLQELDVMLADGAEAVLTPHILQPAEQDEVHDGKMLIYGIYNLGFLALRNTPSVQIFLPWWGRRLEYDCVEKLDKGLFVDQKWADLLPAFVPGTRVLHHPGYNVAYWNLPQRKVTRREARWYVNNLPMRFVHFSGNRIDDPTVFSRHSAQVTIESIGDLHYLLDYYREQVFSQGHQFYRKLPYAYSWNGESGVNLHTPKELDMADSVTIERDSVIIENDSVIIEKNSPQSGIMRRVDIVWRALPVARARYGGWLPLTIRAWRAFRNNGWSHVKAGVVELSKFRPPPASNPSTNYSVDLPSDHKRVLYLDWSIPKPDHDAASVTAVQLMRIMTSLGYTVTFVPCNLQYVEGYYESLVAIGVDVLCYPRIVSLTDWITENAKHHQVCVMARGPVVWPYIDTLKKYAPNARLIFNTVDLHYLREIRQAELNNDKIAYEAALNIRSQEFDLIRQCDLTILLSNEELYTVREVYPDAPLTVLPVVFEDMPGSAKPFDDRRDILFIGSFPHQPNIDAVLYFSEHIFPIVQKRIPGIRLKVIGANPPESILALTKNSSIEVLGFVKDLKPLFDNIRLSIAPLRYGAGIKGKIGTSLCYGVPCIATPIAVEGMSLCDGENVLVGETPEEFANALCLAYLDKQVWQRISEKSHQFAMENYSVEVIRERVKNMFQGITEGCRTIGSSFETTDRPSCLPKPETALATSDESAAP